MTKLVLLHKPESIYDDLPEERYHFPRRPYMKAMREAVGDWIVYHEPKGRGARRAHGSQVYFAVARVERIDPDPSNEAHAYARLTDFSEFVNPVGLYREDGIHHESDLHEPDGSTNAGHQQRAVRRIGEDDFLAILHAGMAEARRELERDRGIEPSGITEGGEQTPYERATVPQLLNRKHRDAAFRIRILRAYDSACAFTDLKIVNGRQRAEVDAAHIRPVGDNHRGSDSTRNGIALSKTIHWLFDRGIVAVSDQYEILEAPGRLPEQLKPLFRPDGRIRLPERAHERPAIGHLRYHRDMFEDEFGRFRRLM